MKPGGLDVFAGKNVVASSHFSQGLPGSSGSKEQGLQGLFSILQLNELPTFMCDDVQCFLGFPLDHLVDYQEERTGEKSEVSKVYKVYQV